MKVIIDTNVFVSGIFWSGTPGKIIMAWIEDKLRLAVNQSILDEYLRVIEHLSQKYKHIDPEPIINMIMFNSELHQDLEFTTPLCRDPDDDKFIACALSAKTNNIISGDKDLLECDNLPKGIQVIKPNEFYQTYLSH